MRNPLDSETVEQIRRLGGDKLMGELAEIFVSQAPIRMGELRAGLAKDDLERAGKAAHSFRSSSISLGARDVAGQAAVLERLAGQDAMEEIQEKLPDFEAIVDELVDFLSAEYGGGS